RRRAAARDQRGAETAEARDGDDGLHERAPEESGSEADGLAGAAAGAPGLAGGGGGAVRYMYVASVRSAFMESFDLPRPVILKSFTLTTRGRQATRANKFATWGYLPCALVVIGISPTPPWGAAALGCRSDTPRPDCPAAEETAR